MLVFLCLTSSLRMTISESIPVATNGIISKLKGIFSEISFHSVMKEWKQSSSEPAIQFPRLVWTLKTLLMAEAETGPSWVPGQLLPFKAWETLPSLTVGSWGWLERARHMELDFVPPSHLWHPPTSWPWGKYFSIPELQFPYLHMWVWHSYPQVYWENEKVRNEWCS